METKIETEAKIKISRDSFGKIWEVLNQPKFIAQKNDFFRNPLGELIRSRFEDGVFILNRKTDVNTPTDFKSKKEEETFLCSKESEEILLFLGFEKFFSYEKERANFDWNGCIVSLDKLEQDQYYIEIEGEEDKIKEIICQLSLEEKPLERKSYLEILSEKREREIKVGGV